MNFKDIDDITSPENKAKAEKAQAARKQVESDLAKAYARCFATNDGKRVLADLYGRMVVGNVPKGDEPNVNYLSAYKNGESGSVTYIQAQITRAGVI